MYRILFCRVCRDDLDIMFHSPPNATWHPEVELVVVLLARDTNLSRRGTCPNGRDLLAALLLLSFIRSRIVIQTSNMLDFALPIKASLLDSVFSPVAQIQRNRLVGSATGRLRKGQPVSNLWPLSCCAASLVQRDHRVSFS